MDETKSGGWESWIQTVAGSAVDKYASANWTQPYQLEAMKIQANGSNGTRYDEGQANQVSKPLGGISPMILLLAGAAIVALVMLRD